MAHIHLGQKPSQIYFNYSADVENPLLLLENFPLKSPCQIGRQDSELAIPIKDKLGPRKSKPYTSVE